MPAEDGVPLLPGGRPIGDPFWDAWAPPQLAQLLRGVTAPWCVAAGWALDLFRGEQTREHEDLEIAVPNTREAFGQVRNALAGYEIEVAGGPASGAPVAGRRACVRRPSPDVGQRGARAGEARRASRTPTGGQAGSTGSTSSANRSATVSGSAAATRASPCRTRRSSAATRPAFPSWRRRSSCCSRQSTPGPRTRQTWPACCLCSHPASAAGWQQCCGASIRAMTGSALCETGGTRTGVATAISLRRPSCQCRARAFGLWPRLPE